MKQIWAPWRIEYIEMRKPLGCIFCKLPREQNDEKKYILYRGSKNFIILNNYPYNNGHLMVATFRHVKSLEDLEDEEFYEHFSLVKKSVQALRLAYNPDGFNIGLNLGKIAGAGVENHLHTHVVPRWLGDTNFMPVVGDVKVIAEALDLTYKKLKKVLG